MIIDRAGKRITIRGETPPEWVRLEEHTPCVVISWIARNSISSILYLVLELSDE